MIKIREHQIGRDRLAYVSSATRTVVVATCSSGKFGVYEYDYQACTHCALAETAPTYARALKAAEAYV